MKNILKELGDRYTNRNYRKRLKNDNFTILCSNCIGGAVSHYCGKEFLSPTVNLWIRQDDFIKLCCNLKWYMAQKLEFIKTSENYPVARCGDITIHFNHDNIEQEAEAKWERRKKRINYNNLYIVMYVGDGITEEDIRKLESVPCKNKVVLSPVETTFRLPYVKYFKPNGTDWLSMRGMDRDIFGIRSIMKQFDFIEFLNEGV